MTETTPSSSYARVQILSGGLVLFVVAASLLAPMTHLNVGEYLGLAIMSMIACSPVIVSTNRRWFKVGAGIVMVIWALYMLSSLGWGVLEFEILILPIPLLISWLFPPVPADRRVFWTIASSFALVVVLIVTMSGLINANEGDVLYVCSNGSEDAHDLEVLGEKHPAGRGYVLPAGVWQSRKTPGGQAFHFDPFTEDDRDALAEEALETEWVTEVRINEPCPAELD